MGTPEYRSTFSITKRHHLASTNSIFIGKEIPKLTTSLQQYDSRKDILVISANATQY